MKFFLLDLQFFAKKLGGRVASTNCNHTSNAQRRGVKVFGGEKLKSGGIIARQVGTKFLVGANTYLGKDYTIHAKIDGHVKFYKKKVNNHLRTFVEVVPFVNN